VEPPDDLADPLFAERLAIVAGPFIEAVGQEHEHVAGGHRDPGRSLVRRLREKRQRQPLGRQFADGPRGGFVVQDRPLAGTEKLDDAGRRIEDPAEGGHEPVVGEVEAEEPVHVVDRPFEPRRTSDKRAEKRPGLRHDQGGPDAVAGRVGDGDREPAVGERQKIEEVAPRLVGGAIPAGDVEACDRRIRAWQQALLDGAGEVEVALDPLLLGEVVEEPLPLDRDPRLAAEESRDLLVAPVERAAPLVEQLQHADGCLVVVGEPHGEHASRAEAARPVEILVEAGIGVGVGEVHEPAGLGHGARKPAARREADLRDRRILDPGGDPAAELVAGLVVEKHGRPLAFEEVRGGRHDRGEHAVEIDRRPEPPGDVEKPFEIGRPAVVGERGHRDRLVEPLGVLASGPGSRRI